MIIARLLNTIEAIPYEAQPHESKTAGDVAKEGTLQLPKHEGQALFVQKRRQKLRVHLSQISHCPRSGARCLFPRPWTLKYRTWRKRPTIYPLAACGLIVPASRVVQGIVHLD